MLTPRIQVKRLEHLAYEEEKGAEEKLRLFMEFTLVKEQDVTAENSVLQEAADLDENRYMLDRFSTSSASVSRNILPIS